MNILFHVSNSLDVVEYDLTVAHFVSINPENGFHTFQSAHLPLLACQQNLDCLSGVPKPKMYKIGKRNLFVSHPLKESLLANSNLSQPQIETLLADVSLAFIQLLGRVPRRFSRVILFKFLWAPRCLLAR